MKLSSSLIALSALLILAAAISVVGRAMGAYELLPSHWASVALLTGITGILIAKYVSRKEQRER